MPITPVHASTRTALLLLAVALTLIGPLACSSTDETDPGTVVVLDDPYRTSAFSIRPPMDWRVTFEGALPESPGQNPDPWRNDTLITPPQADLEAASARATVVVGYTLDSLSGMSWDDFAGICYAAIESRENVVKIEEPTKRALPTTEARRQALDVFEAVVLYETGSPDRRLMLMWNIPDFETRTGYWSLAASCRESDFRRLRVLFEASFETFVTVKQPR